MNLQSAAADRIHCPQCGSGYPRTNVDGLCMLLPSLSPEKGETPDTLYKRTLGYLTAERLPADPMSPWNQKLSSESVRVVATSGEKTGPAILVIVASSWNRKVMHSVFNDLLRLAKFMEEGRVASRFQFIAPQPLPAPIHYTFGSTNRGRFERMALKESKGLYDPKIVVSPSRAKKLAELAIHLVKTCFRIPLDGKDPKQIKWVEELVLKELRLPFAPHEPMPKHSYVPWCSILLMSVLVGHLMSLSKDAEVSWHDEGTYPFSLSLSIEPAGQDEEMSVDLIGQVSNLFLAGAATPLARTCEELIRKP